mmetsp:Transcript_18033/g.61452  ORF Transcript_18033/g.61452 Transcript_18033/m.61452 type:complete len:212 (-) Transcript_18033:557-1192(-)
MHAERVHIRASGEHEPGDPEVGGLAGGLHAESRARPDRGRPVGLARVLPDRRREAGQGDAVVHLGDGLAVRLRVPARHELRPGQRGVHAARAARRRDLALHAVPGGADKQGELHLGLLGQWRGRQRGGDPGGLRASATRGRARIGPRAALPRQARRGAAQGRVGRRRPRGRGGRAGVQPLRADSEAVRRRRGGGGGGAAGGEAYKGRSAAP